MDDGSEVAVVSSIKVSRGSDGTIKLDDLKRVRVVEGNKVRDQIWSFRLEQKME